MLNFDYHNPTRIAFGQGRIADLATLVPAQAKVLILVGGASAEKPARWPKCAPPWAHARTPLSAALSPTPATRRPCRPWRRSAAKAFDFCSPWAAAR